VVVSISFFATLIKPGAQRSVRDDDYRMITRRKSSSRKCGNAEEEFRTKRPRKGRTWTKTFYSFQACLTGDCYRSEVYRLAAKGRLAILEASYLSGLIIYEHACACVIEVCANTSLNNARSMVL
jgi:hypothetical protein